jgi:transcriptional regulator with GAF, ATPase, and Fis domain
VQATVVAALDHLLRGIMWPQSVYGVLAASQWRWLEQTAWAVVADIFLVVSCVRSVAEMRQRADRTAALEQEVRVRHVAEKDARNREWRNDAVLDAAQAALAERVSLASLTAAVGLALTHGPDTRAMLQKCAAALVHHFDDGFAAIWTLDEHDQMLDLQASAGVETPVDAAYSRVPAGRFAIGAIARERKPHITVGFSVDAQIGGAEWALRKGLAAFAGFPLLLDSKTIGVMAVFARRDFSPSAIDAMAAVADSIALGIGRKRSERELARHPHNLRHAHET